MKFSIALPLSVLVCALTLAGCGRGVGVTGSTAPTASLTAAPTTVQSGGTSQLTWISTNAVSCTASGAWTGAEATSGTQSTAPLTADASYTLTCVNAAGTAAAATATVAVAKVPTVALSAAPTDVASGGSSTLTWSSTDATSCTASGGWTGALATSGTQSTGALTASTMYSLVCSGAGGSSPSASTTVTVNAAPVTPPAVPTATLTAAPASVASGAASTLTWTSTGATSCTATGGWTGALATSGSKSTGALTANTTYSLTCAGAGGTSAAATAAVSVTTPPPPPPVTAAPTVALSAAPKAVASGSASTLTWTSTNATACTASGAWTGAVATSGSKSTGALTTNSTFALSCTGPGGTSAAVSTVVNVVPTATLTANPAVVASGAASTLTWTSTNATACTASGAWTGPLATSGTKSTGALTTNSTFTLTCTGLGGTSTAVSAVVNLTPTATLTANPTVVAGGAASTLTWTSTNATACTASGSWAGPLAASGTKSTGPVNINSSFSLTCTGAGGTSAVATAVVNVTPTAMLTAAPLAVASGGASTLTWSSTNATACTASGAWTGALAAMGSQSTGALTATKTYSLTCSGAGGTSTVVSVTVTLSNGTGVLTPRSASLTLTQTQQFTATLAGGAAATWSVDGVAGGNANVGTVSAAGLYTAPATIVTTHAHTILATSVTDGTTATGSVAVTELAGVYTYHNDTSRDGVNAQEYALTTANVNTATFGVIAKCPVDGAVYAQPLWVANVTVGGVKHNVVYVATEHNGLFAFDADSNSCTTTGPLWSVNLIDTNHGAAAGEIPVPASYTGSGDPGWVGAGFGDISPEVGVTGTPVIDPATGTLYVVTKSATDTAADITAGNNRQCPSCVQRLHAIDITTGAEKTGSPIVIAGTYPGTGDGNGATTVTFNSAQELQRAGLAFANGVVYVAFTAHEDKAPWYGWMMSYNYGGGGFTRTAVINVAPNAQKSGIWMSGGAPAIDPHNNSLYALTGNGNFTVTSNGNDYGDSLVQFSSTDLTVQQYFTPSNQATDNNNDQDFGAGGATVMADLPGSTVIHALIAGGKDGNMYVLNRDMLGGGGGDGAAVQKFALRNGNLFATGAIWSNTFYITAAGGPVEGWTLNTTTTTFARANQSTNTFGGKGATPSVSASATQNGIVWALNAAAYCTHQAGACAATGVYAYDATNLGTMLWNSNTVGADAAGYPIKFAVPTIANGKVYVGTRGNNIGGHYGSTTVNGELDIYGLKP